MSVTLFHCGPAANESELKAFMHLKTRLLSEAFDQTWVLLTNLTFSVTHQLQSDEIDLIAIGPPGVRVVEIKHWAASWMDAHEGRIAAEMERVTNKARKIGTTLRKNVPNLPHVYVEGSLLLTQEPSKVKRVAGREIHGVGIHTLNDWKAAINYDAPQVLSAAQVQAVASQLQPESMVAIDGSLRRLAGYTNLELHTPQNERFHRVYRGSHASRRDRVILHLYDLSASDDKNAEAKAKREFEALHRLQHHLWAPRILDSYQEAPGYAGEMFFFTVVDPAAPPIEERARDETWTMDGRLAFARQTVRALAELHEAGTAAEPLVHRNLTPHTILVKHDNTPIFTGFERTKIPDDVTVASSSLLVGDYLATAAPEVQAQGLAAADHRSDIYALCASLRQLFIGRTDPLSQRALEALARGLAETPAQRSKLSELEAALSELLGESVPPPPPPPARYWTEEQVIRFRGHDYRIVTRLGSGGIGTTFKVVQIDRHSHEELGTYVAKVVRDAEIGNHVLKAYRLVRSHLSNHAALSMIFEVANDWRENEFVALMRWVSGTPLSDYVGIFPLLAEDLQEASAEALAIRWLQSICEGLGVLHRNGLIHGDVSPRNLIVSEGNLVLTDYDFVTKIGTPLTAEGTLRYCSPSHQEKQPASPADDLYALAASFFHVLFEREPFCYEGVQDKKRGLNWEGLDRAEFPILAPFLTRATHPNSELRFASVNEALDALSIEPGEKVGVPPSPPAPPIPASNGEQQPPEPLEQLLREQRIPWLRSLLQSYPGSRWGNSETRGLDTDFAAQTYVETVLEETLLEDIRQRAVRLVVLCGNAGDGKTALLQHLAGRLGLGKRSSAERIFEGQVTGGPLVRMNLDGSASWQGKTANEILDDFLRPFQNGEPAEDIVHLLAINDGRLLEWIDAVEQQHGGNPTSLTADLYKLLQLEAATQKGHIRFINLNQRSLVGGVGRNDEGQPAITTPFLERLVDQLYGGQQAPDIWSACLSCTAQERCRVFQAARLFGPSTLPSLDAPDIRSRARERLFEALQAVHLRGETHITMRELRAALVYILFGVHFCEDYHRGEVDDMFPYWDRAFQPDSPARQGELLVELVRFDPALEAHPKIDRYLLSAPITADGESPPIYPHLDLESARRRSYFEWSEEALEHVAEDAQALGLAHGRHLHLFRSLPLLSDEERARLCAQLCKGISRLEDLPPQAHNREGVVPLRVTPRTPTETALWVEKSLSHFRLEADLPQVARGVETLHRQAFLIYRYRDSDREERLRLGAELFHLLLELADGYQLGDTSTDATFAHLSIFVQRLVREDERELFAWNPMQDEQVYRIAAALQQTASGRKQQMQITPM